MTGEYGLIYRLLFFYLEPISALGGSYLTHFAPQNYFSIVIPGNNDPILTNTQLLATNLASSYIHFTIVEALLLRMTNDIKVWRAAVFAMFVNDIVHIYGLHAARSEVGLSLAWDLTSGNDWKTFLPTYVPLLLRFAFLAGYDGWTANDKHGGVDVIKKTAMSD